MGRNPLRLSLTSLLVLIVTGAPTVAQTTFNIRRANLDGSNIQTVLTGVSDNSFIGVAVGAGKIYWSSFSAPDGIILIGVSILMGVCRADRIVAEVVDGAHRCWLAGYG